MKNLTLYLSVIALTFTVALGGLLVWKSQHKPPVVVLPSTSLEVPPQGETSQQQEEPVVPQPELNKNRPSDEALLAGSVLTTKEEWLFAADSNVTWKVSSDKRLAYGIYLEKTDQPRMLPKGTPLEVISATKELVILPGRVLSVRNQTVVVKVKTAGGVELHLIALAGNNLEVTDRQFKGTGTVPTIAELEKAFDVKLAGPGLIRVMTPHQ